MLIKITKVSVIIIMAMIFMAKAACADVRAFTSPGSDLFSDVAALTSSLVGLGEVTGFTKPVIKQGESYEETKDPALHKSTPPEEGPKHGYFAVSLLVISIVGVLIYFLKID